MLAAAMTFDMRAQSQAMSPQYSMPPGESALSYD